MRSHSIMGGLAALCLWLGGCGDAPVPVSSTSHALSELRYTASQLLSLSARPIVLGHEGDGENLADAAGRPADPTRPINDTVRSVQLGYEDGASVVEVDVEITKDGHPVANHDFDFLPDGTCINSYTLAELQRRAPYIPSLEGILNQAKRFNRGSAHLSGLLVIELKTPSPRCDPGDTSKPALVQAVVGRVRALRMEDAVIFDAFSPDLVALAAALAPEIPREMDLDVLQLLTPAQVTAATGLPVRIMPDKHDFGLTWAEVGDVYRLPAYPDPLHFLGLAKALGASIIDYEMDFVATFDQLHAADPSIPDAAGWVGIAHDAFGFKVAADPARTTTEFLYLAGKGVDYIYTDPIAQALAFQPPL